MFSVGGLLVRFCPPLFLAPPPPPLAFSGRGSLSIFAVICEKSGGRGISIPPLCPKRWAKQKGWAKRAEEQNLARTLGKRLWRPAESNF